MTGKPLSSTSRHARSPMCVNGLLPAMRCLRPSTEAMEIGTFSPSMRTNNAHWLPSSTSAITLRSDMYHGRSRQIPPRPATVPSARLRICGR
jgi:hypothetical protein